MLEPITNIFTHQFIFTVFFTCRLEQPGLELLTCLPFMSLSFNGLQWLTVIAIHFLNHFSNPGLWEGWSLSKVWQGQQRLAVLFKSYLAPGSSSTLWLWDNMFTLHENNPQFDSRRSHKTSLRVSQASVVPVPLPSLDKWEACVRKTKHVDASAAATPRETSYQLRVSSFLSPILSRAALLHQPQTVVREHRQRWR